MRLDGERSRVGFAFVCAFAVHAAVTLAVRLRAPSAAPPTPLAQAASTANELEFTLETLAPEGTNAPAEVPHAPSSEHAAIARASAPRAKDSPSPPEGASPDTESPALPEAAPAAPADSSWSLRITRVDLGVDPRGGQSLVGRAATSSNGASGTTENGDGRAPPSTTGGLAESLDESDVAMGLGRGGPIRSAVEEAVQAANVMGTAAFEVSIEASGGVTVGLRNASADASSWSRLTEAIRTSVVAKRASVRLPPGARGLRVVVQAEAKDLLPDGRSPSRLGTRLEGTVGQIKETRERIEIKLPSATLAHEGKLCAAGVHVGFDGVGILGGCSPENAGKTPVRMVAARIVSEARL